MIFARPIPVCAIPTVHPTEARDQTCEPSHTYGASQTYHNITAARENFTFGAHAGLSANYSP